MINIKKLQNMIDESNQIVFFGGAGTSTDSGLKDFRSKNGLYQENLNAEYMLSSDCFYNNTEKFYEYYKNNMNFLNAKPTTLHFYLKRLEDIGKLKGIITQNIDGLHQKAGSQKVYEIHGTIYKNHCLKCHKSFDAKYIFNSKNCPKCSCNGIIKPDVVLYGEMLRDSFNKAIELIENADMLIVAGTSLTVEPASSLVKIFKGKYLVIINNDETPLDYKANLVIHENINKVFGSLK